MNQTLRLTVEYFNYSNANRSKFGQVDFSVYLLVTGRSKMSHKCSMHVIMIWTSCWPRQCFDDIVQASMSSTSNIIIMKTWLYKCWSISVQIAPHNHRVKITNEWYETQASPDPPSKCRGLQNVGCRHGHFACHYTRVQPSIMCKKTICCHMIQYSFTSLCLITNHGVSKTAVKRNGLTSFNIAASSLGCVVRLIWPSSVLNFICYLVFLHLSWLYRRYKTFLHFSFK